MSKERGAVAIALSGVCAGYNGSAIISGIDLEVQRGEYVAVVGPSGSGKTTLLRVMAGLLTPTTGTIQRATTNGSGSRYRIAYIPQHLGLVRNCTALQNVLIGALPRLTPLRSLLGAFPKSERIAAQQALTLVGLDGRGSDRVETMSGGERRRVAIARALLQKPDLLLADEFLAEVDKVTARDILSLLRELRSSQLMTTIVVDHDLDAAREVADRIVVIVDGVKVTEVKPSEVSAASLAQLFRPAANRN